MTFTSYNDWLASPAPKDFGGLDNRVVPGTFDTRLRPGVRAGAVAEVLFYVAAQLHARVESGALYNPGDEWGYSFRKNRNADNLSCHASGTAFDWNATRHPNGKSGTYSREQVAEIRKILAEVGGIVRWGGDFSKTKDEMHFEITKGISLERVQKVAEALRGSTPPPPVQPPAGPPTVRPEAPVGATVEQGDHGPGVVEIQWSLNRLGYEAGEIDGIFGPSTAEALQEFQEAAGLDADCVAGPATRRALAAVPNFPGVTREGMRNSFVTQAYQSRLRERGWTVSVDGDHGPATTRVLKQFQTEKRLSPVDGVGGADTWNALYTRSR